MQLSDIQAECGRLLGDPNNDRWTTAVLNTRINAACLDILVWTNSVKTTESLTPTANTSTVAVSANVIDILQVALIESDGTVTPLTGRNRDQLDFLRPNWENESAGRPDAWCFDATNRNIILVPAPSAAYAISGGLRVREVQQPSAMAAASEVPFSSNSLMVPFHRAIVYWTVSECLKDNLDADSLKKAKYFRSNDLQKPGEYENEIRKILMKFDVPEAIPGQVLIQKQGGRIGGPIPSKRYPFLP